MIKPLAAGACLLLGVALGAPVYASNFEDEAKKFVSDAFATASGLTKGTSEAREKSASRFANFIERRIATKALASFVLGPYWRRASKAERAEFHSLFRTYLTRSLGRQAARLITQPVKIDKIVKSDGNGDLLVFSRLGRRGSSALLIDWRIRRTDNGPMLIDVIVQGTSLAVAQRQQFMSLMSRNGGSIAALNARMRTHNKGKPGGGGASVADQPVAVN